MKKINWWCFFRPVISIVIFPATFKRFCQSVSHIQKASFWELHSPCIHWFHISFGHGERTWVNRGIMEPIGGTENVVIQCLNLKGLLTTALALGIHLELGKRLKLQTHSKHKHVRNTHWQWKLATITGNVFFSPSWAALRLTLHVLHLNLTP